MSLSSSICNNRQHKATIYALKKLLPNKSNDNKTHLLSLLQKSNIEIDSINCFHTNANTSNTNYNNSYVPIETDDLSALYAYYQIDSYLYPPPDLQLFKTIQSSKLQYHSLSEQQIKDSNNSTRKSQNWRTKQKRLRSNKKRKNNNNNKQAKTNNFHYRNMITVRRVSCDDMIDSQMTIKKHFKNEKKIQNEWKKKKKKKKTKPNNLIENQSQKYKTFSTELQSSPPFVKLHTSSIQSPECKSFVVPSTTTSNMTTLTTPISNFFFQQPELNKKMSNSMSMPGLKITSLGDSSVSSLVSTQLFSDAYNQMKPNVTNIAATPTSGSKIDFGSTATSSVVPHFSSTIISHLSHHTSSSIVVVPKISKTNSNVPSTSTNENIQDLINQLNTCIATLSLILQNEKKSEKARIPNEKSYSTEKKLRLKKKSSQSASLSSPSLSLVSTSDQLRFSKNSMSNENNLVFEEITVRRCNSSKIQDRTNYQSNIPTLYDDQHNELKRCLLVYCRNRANNSQDRNINSNERQRNSHDTRNDLASNKHLSLSQSFQSIPNNSIDILSGSISTLILAEGDDKYEPLNEL